MALDGRSLQNISFAALLLLAACNSAASTKPAGNEAASSGGQSKLPKGRLAYRCTSDCDDYGAGIVWAEEHPNADPDDCPQESAAHRLGCLEALWVDSEDAVQGWLDNQDTMGDPP